MTLRDISRKATQLSAEEWFRVAQAAKLDVGMDDPLTRPQLEKIVHMGERYWKHKQEKRKQEEAQRRQQEEALRQQEQARMQEQQQTAAPVFEEDPEGLLGYSVSRVETGEEGVSDKEIQARRSMETTPIHTSCIVTQFQLRFVIRKTIIAITAIIAILGQCRR